MTRVLVCGGRHYSDWARVIECLDCIQVDRKISLVIHGGALGADDLGSRWAYLRGIPSKVFPAHWGMHGKAAGPIRNQQMIEEGKPDLVVAFPGGTGTADMVRRAKSAGIPVEEIAGRAALAERSEG